MHVPGIVTVGGLGRAGLRERLARAGVRLNAFAEQLFSDERFRTARRASRVPIVAVDVAELGFPAGATFAELARAAAGRGLSLCPLELGPHLRLQFSEPREPPTDAGETRGRAPPGAVTVASAPPADGEEVPWGFYLRRIRGEPWLRGYVCRSGHVWAPGDLFVFVR